MPTQAHGLELSCGLTYSPWSAGCSCCPPKPGRCQEKVAALAPSGLVLVMDEKGNELVVQNADKPFVPASVTKIVTAWLAMEVLGGDYRFETRFYLDGDRVLYIRGGGDPFLISEELAQLASELVVAVGKKPLSGIVLDASYYPSDIRIPGIEDTDEAYDALNSALAVNFNTIHAVRKTIRSAEEQTPITPLAISQFRARGAQGRGRISLTQDPAVGLQYAGELIAAFLERAGGSANGKISTGAVPEGLEPVYVHRDQFAMDPQFIRKCRTCKFGPSSTMRAISAARRRGAPSSKPPARPTVQAFIFSFSTCGNTRPTTGALPLAVCAHTSVDRSIRVTGASAASSNNERGFGVLVISTSLPLNRQPLASVNDV